MQRPTFLEHRHYRDFKLSIALLAAALVGYWLTRPSGGEPYGGTWFGYLLGILSALIVLLHLWYGIRKRRAPRFGERRRHQRRRQLHVESAGAASRKIDDRRRISAEDHWRFGGSLQGWLSAHAYLGVALVVLAALHAGFRFGWNLHTFAFALLTLTVASGMYGTFVYLRYPRLIAENLCDHALPDLLLKIAELDELARQRALDLPDEVNALVTRARQGTRIGGNLWQRLNGRQRGCPTDRAVERVQELAARLIEGEQPRRMRDLYSVLLQKQRLVAIARTEIRLNARLQFWLALHVPLSIGLLAALLGHVLTVLIYW